MGKAIAIIAACALSIWIILPELGGYCYTIGGITCGLVALLVVAYKANQDHASYSFTGAFSLLAGALVGVFWPVVLITGLVWINRDGGKGESGAGSEPPASA